VAQFSHNRSLDLALANDAAEGLKSVSKLTKVRCSMDL
jgi:hypothetical protein